LGLDGYHLEFATVDRSGISATHAQVHTAPEHAHRHLSQILKIIGDSRLSESVKTRSARIFTRLGEAEARVHNVPVEKIHFHEVGALDAIIDVVGACICFDLLDIERFACSALHVGSGTIDISHGRFPVPPPAVAELLRDAPIYSTDIVGELVTPTGAAIITTVCRDFGTMPRMKLQRTGYGAGTRTYEKFPNALRVMIGEDQSATGDSEQLWMIETNVDDASPQVFGYVMERALELGALDCYLTPIQMKKNRPGVLLSILCRPADKDRLTQMVFAETTTLGVRSWEVERRALDREMVMVETEYGAIEVKVARLNGRVITETPEYEQVRQAALNAKVSMRTVEAAARAALARRGTTE
jgi:uncharacterized protein (TIGR00299 family) protein